MAASVSNPSSTGITRSSRTRSTGGSASPAGRAPPGRPRPPRPRGPGAPGASARVSRFIRLSSTTRTRPARHGRARAPRRRPGAIRGAARVGYRIAGPARSWPPAPDARGIERGDDPIELGRAAADPSIRARRVAGAGLLLERRAISASAVAPTVRLLPLSVWAWRPSVTRSPAASARSMPSSWPPRPRGTCPRPRRRTRRRHPRSRSMSASAAGSSVTPAPPGVAADGSGGTARECRRERLRPDRLARGSRPCPPARHISRSPSIAFAVIAMIRSGRSGQRARIRRVASSPSISGIWTSMSTTSYGSRSSASSDLEAVAGDVRGVADPLEQPQRRASGSPALSSASRMRSGCVSARPAPACAGGAGRAGRGRSGAEHGHHGIEQRRRLDGLGQLRRDRVGPPLARRRPTTG